MELKMEKLPADVPQNKKDVPTTKQDFSQSKRALSVLSGCLAVGCLIIPLFAAQAPDLGQFASIIGASLVVACAASLLGGLLGFLFGIPRTLQQGERPVNQKNEKEGAVPGDYGMETTYAVNTNLEQISDWLTKILVGVGLTQITKFADAIRKYADFAGPGLGNFPNSKVFSIALLGFFLIDGFLIGYLWTRLHLAGALKQADEANRLKAVETKLDIIDIDARAWSLVQRLLNPPQGSSPPAQEEINVAITAASGNMKAQIFWASFQFRSDNWRLMETKPKMERTIPIFRALIASDTENVYHANHGQLGYALKDQREPDWENSESELTKAIKLRGNWQKSGWLPHYEFARAICRINKEGAFKVPKTSDAKIIQDIMSDINAACENHETKQLVKNDPDIKKWTEINNIKLSK
jgi:hypothetical protein